MAGDGVLYKWDDKELQALVASSISRVNDMSPAMKSFAEYMVTRTDDRFQSEQAPDGSPWEPLKTITLLRKQKMNAIDKILQQDGFLRLVHPESDSQSAGAYSDRIYGAIHNRGGMAGPGHKVKIPKREFLGFNDEDIREFQETMADWVILGRKP